MNIDNIVHEVFPYISLSMKYISLEFMVDSGIYEFNFELS